MKSKTVRLLGRASCEGKHSRCEGVLKLKWELVSLTRQAL